LENQARNCSKNSVFDIPSFPIAFEFQKMPLQNHHFEGLNIVDADRELNKSLHRICKNLPTDFRPWGERDRDAEWGPDCSCGCKFFLKLPGQLGNDWGVCWNPESPRSGLLTFEHQGCRHFVEEKELWDEDC
jgi:hypothetical protein